MALTKLELSKGRNLFFLLSFSIGIPRIFTLTAADSLFLQYFDAGFLPWVYVIRALVVPLVGFLVLQLDRHHGAGPVRAMLLILSAAILLVLRSVYQTNPELSALILVQWVGLEWTLTGLVFWNSANQFFPVRQAKESFGFISSGEVLAGIIGGLLVGPLMGIMSIPDLLYVSAGGTLGSLALLIYLGRFQSGKQGGTSSPLPKGNPFAQGPHLGSILKRPLVQSMILLVCLDYGIHYFADNLFYLEVQDTIGDGPTLGTFLGRFFAGLSFVHLIFKVFLTKPLLSKLGLAGGLWLGPIIYLPLALALAIPGTGMAPGLLPLILASAAKFVQMVTGDAFFTPATYSFYQVLPPKERSTAQNFADAIAGRLAGGLAGLVLMGLLTLAGFLGFDPRYLVALGMVALGIGTLVLTSQAWKNYRSLIASQIKLRQETKPNPISQETHETTVDITIYLTVQEYLSKNSGKLLPWFSKYPWLQDLVQQNITHSLEILLGPIPHVARAIPEIVQTDDFHRESALEYIESFLTDQERHVLLPSLEAIRPWETIIQGRSQELPDPRILYSLAQNLAKLPHTGLSRGAIAHLLITEGHTIHPCPRYFGMVRNEPQSLLLRSVQKAWATSNTQGSILLKRMLFLQQVGIFSGLPHAALADLAAYAQPRVWKSGVTIFSKGEPGESLYVLVQGEAQVLDGSLVLATMGQGMVIGEYAVLSPAPRSATIVCATQVQALELDVMAVYRVFNAWPAAARATLMWLSRRLFIKDYREFVIHHGHEFLGILWQQGSNIHETMAQKTLIIPKDQIPHRDLQGVYRLTNGRADWGTLSFTPSKLPLYGDPIAFMAGLPSKWELIGFPRSEWSFIPSQDLWEALIKNPNMLRLALDFVLHGLRWSMTKD